MNSNETEYNAPKLKLDIRRGAILGFFQSGLIFLMVTMAILLDAGEDTAEDGNSLAYFDDPWNYIDSVSILICAIFLLLGSRTAAILLALNFVYGMYDAVFLQHRLGTLLASPFLIFYLKSVAASFRYRALLRGAKQPEKKPSVEKSILTGVVVVLGSAITVFLFFRSTGPPTDVIPGTALTIEDYEFLISEGIVESSEEIIWFYSGGVFSIFEDGNLVTDWRVISYQMYDGKRWVASAEYHRIKELDVIRRGSTFRDTLVSVKSKDHSSFELAVTAKSDGDEMFIREIRRRMKDSKLVNRSGQ
jgi:hypothetical protein